MTKCLGLFASATLLTCAGCSAIAPTDTKQMRLNRMSQHVEHMATDTTPARPIAGAQANLLTSSDGATMTLTTGQLEPGHVTTAWWVIMTRPELCETSPCSPEDVIGGADRVGTQIVYADGVVNGSDGTASFSAHLAAGEVQNGWYDQSFDNPGDAEIHLVLNDHGPLLPEIAASMLTSYRGGCSDDSLPPPFPATAKANGTPGPNSCQLIQDAIFMQAMK